MKINISIELNKPKWLTKLFPCKHTVVSVEENYDSRYGTHTSYLYCLKCGRETMEIERNCKHYEDSFGICTFCKSRLSKFDCKHNWLKEPDTDDFYCGICGEWREEPAVHN